MPCESYFTACGRGGNFAFAFDLLLALLGGSIGRGRLALLAFGLLFLLLHAAQAALIRLCLCTLHS